MTMTSMDQYLTDRGFEVKRKYDPCIKKYKFTISKDDRTLQMLFEYPATGDVAVRDKKQREFLEEMVARFKKEFEDDESLYPKTMVAVMEVPKWRDPDTYLNIEDMCAVLRDNGMSVETEDHRNIVGKNEVHFYVNKNGRTLHRILYEYELGTLQRIQEHRKYFLQEIIDTFEAAEKYDEDKSMHFMGIVEMIEQLEDRGFKAESDYDARRKIYFIHARKGDWHVVREVEYFDILLRSREDIDNQARKRQDTLDSIFEAYKEYERKKILNSLYGTRINQAQESNYIYVTTAGFGSSTVFKEHLQKFIAEQEKDMRKNELATYCALDVAMTKALHQKTNPHKLPEIKKVIFNNPATIVIWADDTKTIVKAQNGETFDPEKGLAMAITKKSLGNEGRYFDVIKKWAGPVKPEYEYVIKKLKLDKRLACTDLQYVLKDKKATKADLIAAMQRALHYLERDEENEN